MLAKGARFHVECARSDVLIAELPNECVNLAILDIPYFGMKDEDWDNAWPSAAAFLVWVGEQAEMWRRVLTPNGSLYVFASPQMAWGVEGVIRDRFDVLNQITWNKPVQSSAEKYGPENFRSYVAMSERVIFAAPPVSAAIEYLRAECARIGLSPEELSGVLGFKPTPGSIAPRRYLSVSGFAPISREHYAQLQRATGAFSKAYDTLYRPFSVSADVPYTDVWTYPTVAAYPGKHPCEKPSQMGADIVAASSRPGDLVADFYCGSGIFLAEAVKAGRRALGCDSSEHWVDVARRRCEMAISTGQTRIRRIEQPSPRQTTLFD